MRISDWSSDVCSSDLAGRGRTLRLLQMAAAEKLGDLHRVERRALSEVVRHAPQGKAVLHRRFLADPPEEGGVIAHPFHRRAVVALLPLIDHHPARTTAPARPPLLDPHSASPLALDPPHTPT